MTGNHGTVEACPECDAGGASLYRRTPGSEGNRSRDPDKDWVCNECAATFDEPIERERHQPSNLGGGTLATQLDELDASDVGGERA